MPDEQVAKGPEMVAMEKVLLSEQDDGGQVILMDDSAGKQYFEMFVDKAQFFALAKERGGLKFDRPLTHELYLNILNELPVEFLRIEIYGQKGNTFLARVVYRKEGQEKDVDARPSDALLLALNRQVPIMVSKALVKRQPTEKEKEFLRDVVKVVKWGDVSNPFDKTPSG